MILDCPACRSRFLVSDSLIPTAGRIVRCSKCTHEWFVQQEQPDDRFERMSAPEPVPTHEPIQPMRDIDAEAEAFAPKRFRATVPSIPRAKVSTKPFKIAAPLIAAVWLVAAFIAYFPSWSTVPGLSGIYHALGVKPLDGVVFADVHMEREQEGSKTRFLISGSIRNHSSSARTVPVVRVELKNKENKALMSREYAVNIELKAGDVYPFRLPDVETAFAKSVSSIVVDMGNPMHLMVR